MLKLTIDATLRGAGKVIATMPDNTAIIIKNNFVSWLSQNKQLQQFEVKKADKITIERL